MGKKVYWTEHHFYRIRDDKSHELRSEWSHQKLMNRRQALEALSEVDPHGRAAAPSLLETVKAARGSV
jgi:hypothetical protein